MEHKKCWEALFILTTSYDSITYYSEIMLDTGMAQLDPLTVPEKDAFHFMALFKQSIIEICCFFEEYDRWYGISEKEYQERILKVRKIVKPAVSKVHDWTEIRAMRNELTAHPFHNKAGEFTYRKLFDYDCPRTYWDLQILRQYLRMIMGAIEQEFAVELKLVPGYINAIHPERKPPSIHENLLDEMSATIDTINTTCEELGLGYRLSKKDIIGLED